MDFEADSFSGAVGSWTDGVFTVDDIVSDDVNISIICTPGSGSAFGFGSATVTCQAEDEAGNFSDECEFDVTVTGNKQKIPDFFIME